MHFSKPQLMMLANLLLFCSSSLIAKGIQNNKLSSNIFINNIENIVITDRLEIGAVLSGLGPFDDETPSGTTMPQNLYFYYDVFDLMEKVQGTGFDHSNVRWDFAELDFDTLEIITIDRSIAINAGNGYELGLKTIPSYEQLVSDQTFPSVGEASLLSFRNDDRTSRSETILPAFLDSTKLIIYFALENDPKESVYTEVIDVFTTNDAQISNGDWIIQPASALISITGISDFEGWYQTARSDIGTSYSSPTIFTEGLGDLPDSIPSLAELNDTADEFEFFDETFKTVPEAIKSLTLMTDTGLAGEGFALNGMQDAYPQLIGFGSFFEGIPSTSNQLIEVEADELYMVRWNLSTPFDATVENARMLPLVQLIVGETGSYGLGRSIMSFDHKSSGNIVGQNLSIRQFFYAHDAGEIGCFINIFDIATDNSATDSFGGYLFPDGHMGHNITIESIEFFRVDTNSLTGEEVVYNQGQEIIPLAPGEPPPPTVNRTGDFDLNFWVGRDQFADIAEDNQASRNTLFNPTTPFNGMLKPYDPSNTTAPVLSYAISPGEGPAYLIWDTINSSAYNTEETDPLLSFPREVLEANEGEVYMMDFWLSATGPTENLPFTRVGMYSGVLSPGNTSIDSVEPYPQAFVAYHEFNPDSTPDMLANGLVANPAIPLRNDAARRVRLVFEPQLTTTNQDTGSLAFRPSMETFVIPMEEPNTAEAAASGTINFHRVTVTKYNKHPSFDSQRVPFQIFDEF